MKILFSLANSYITKLKTAPYSTKMATSCFIYSFSDFICQRYIEKKSFKDYSYLRTFRQALTGAIFVAPTLHLWHSHFIPFATRSIKNRFKTIAVSYALGEGVLSPYFITSVLFLFDYLNTFDVNSGLNNVKEKFWPTIIRSFQFWGVISLFTYSVVPIFIRPIFTNCWGLVWHVYLSFIANFKRQEAFLEEEEETLKESISLA